jgi:Tat protein secretion system quality control protein TatD with DNase activity
MSGEGTTASRHAHLDAPVFERDLDEVLARAQNAGIDGALAVGLHLKRFHASPVEAGELGQQGMGEAF